VPDFGEAVRKDVLEGSTHKLKNLQFTASPFLLSAALIAEGDAAVGDADDPAGRDGDAEDIFREIAQCPFSVADVACIDDPVGFPDAWGHVEPLCLEDLDELGAIDDRERLGVDIEPGGGTFPFGVLGVESAAGHDEVDMRVIVELAGPGVQDAGESGGVAPDEAWIFGQLFHGSRCGFEQRAIARLLIGSDQASQLLRHGEGDHEVVYGKGFGELLTQPVVGFAGLADRAVPYKWARRFGELSGEGSSEGVEFLTPSSAGGMFFGGYYDGSWTIPDATLPAIEGAFAGRIAANGTVAWVDNVYADHLADLADFDYGLELSDGGLIVAGRYRGRIEFGNSIIEQPSGDLNEHVILERFDATGTPLWAVPITSTNGARLRGFDFGTGDNARVWVLAVLFFLSLEVLNSRTPKSVWSSSARYLLGFVLCWIMCSSQMVL